MKRMHAAVRGNIVYGVLAASAIVAFMSVTGLFALPLSTTPQADMRIDPSAGRVMVGDTFTVAIQVSATVPVNVFRGEVYFNPQVLEVASIDYNTSIADLWAELPWYENGDGTMNFTGGTTQRGGFTGDGTLVTITFRAKGPGVASVQLTNARILAHDGLGTDVTLEKPIDAVFAVEEAVLKRETVAAPSGRTKVVAVAPQAPSTDLNGDGKHTIADVSIFMLNMLGSDARFDFNQDGKVNTADLSILVSAR